MAGWVGRSEGLNDAGTQRLERSSEQVVSEMIAEVQKSLYVDGADSNMGGKASSAGRQFGDERRYREERHFVSPSVIGARSMS